MKVVIIKVRITFIYIMVIYILLGDNYINIQGKSRFHYNGTWYVIK